MPAPLVESTIQAAMSLVTSKLGAVGSIPATVKILIEEVPRAMLMHKMRLIGVALVTVGVVASGAGLLAKPKPAAPDPNPRPPEAARLDLQGNNVVVDDETEPHRRSVENNKTAEDSKHVAAKERAATSTPPSAPGRALDPTSDESPQILPLGDRRALRAGARRPEGLRVPEDSDRAHGLKEEERRGLETPMAGSCRPRTTRSPGMRSPGMAWSTH